MKKEVSTNIGTFELIKPKAGVRNKALQKAEKANGSLSRVTFMLEILPKMVSKRPDSCDKDVPIEHLLDSLEMEDYDKLVDGVDALVADEISTDEQEKKKE